MARTIGLIVPGEVHGEVPGEVSGEVSGEKNKGSGKKK